MKIARGLFVLAALVAAASPSFAQNIRDDATGGDCATIGTWVAETKTCLLGQHLVVPSTITILDDNITLDGNGFSLYGPISFGTGITVSGRSGVTIQNITVAAWVTGIAFIGGSNNAVRNSRSEGNVGGAGIYLLGCTDSMLEGNFVQANRGEGIRLDSGSSGNTVRYNTLMDNFTNVLVVSGSNDNGIYNNNLLQTPGGRGGQQAVVAGTTGNFFSLAAPVGGNFWSTWTSPNGNGDTFVDLPFTISPDMVQDLLPWTTVDGWLVGPPDPDTDGDGVPNADDNCPDLQNPEQTDTDLDAQGDACDTDDDNDGVADAGDDCPFVFDPGQVDLDGDGLGDPCDEDLDGDGDSNSSDNCPAVPNPYQDDTDADLLGDACDEDDENDGICDTDQPGTTCIAGPDNCATVPNSSQADLDADGIGDACDADLDGDGIDNAADNCATVPNAAQDDTDQDLAGDACDADDDGDGVPDAADNCPLIANAGQADLDADGAGDACDADVDGDGAGNAGDNCPEVANSGQADLDGDGAGDACDADIDGDSVPNGSDLCAGTESNVTVLPDNGCSIGQLVPCAGPRGTNQPWKNHGQYASSVARAAGQFVAEGLMTAAEKDALLAAAAGSGCGR
jgi:parallel beta-helix repeat protein